MPEPVSSVAARAFGDALNRVAARLRVASIAAAATVASAAAAATLIVLMTTALAPALARIIAGFVFVAAFAACMTSWMRRWTLVRTATTIETRVAGLDNVIVTAAEVVEDAARRPLHRVVGEALWEAAQDRIATVRVEHVQPLAIPIAIAVLSVGAAGLLAVYAPGLRTRSSQLATATAPVAETVLAAGDVRVTLRPPEYVGRDAQTLVNPAEVVALEGTRISLEAESPAGPVRLVEPGQPVVPFERAGGVWHLEFLAQASRVLLVQDESNGGAGRLLNVRVESDRRPLVRIDDPGKDLVLPEATAQVGIDVSAQDDLGLASLVLRYTRVAGSGESFTFEEGEAPIAVQRTSGTEWRGRATLSLPALKLEDGDTLVYRAVATDRRPGADPSASETFLIEIGRIGGVATTGFALPEERDRQALSQQMLIVKTEKLHGARGSLEPGAVLEQSRLLAIEQRMVKAEFVFMTGGEVEDEVAEAEAGHELAEGRGENRNQMDLLAAIREMSRAEARLNAGDTAQALVFERAALRALQRAFDRRRYLLRTLPERARIDASRRLTGDLKDARSSARDRRPVEAVPQVVAARAALRDLAAAVGRGLTADAALASRLLAVDPESTELRRAALTLSTSADRSALEAAARDAAGRLTALMRAHLSAPASGEIVSDPLTGRVADTARAPGARR